VPDAEFEARLPELFPAFLEAAGRLDLGHVSLMFQPERNLIGVVTSAAREGRQAPRLETVRLSTDALALRGSVSDARLIGLGARKIFDRTEKPWLSSPRRRSLVSRDLGWPTRNGLTPMDMLKPGFTLSPVPDQQCVEMAARSRRRHRAAITGQIFRWLLQIPR
jgi:hypothetical protein